MVAPVPRLVNPADVVRKGPLFLVSNPNELGLPVAGLGLVTACSVCPPPSRRQHLADWYSFLLCMSHSPGGHGWLRPLAHTNTNTNTNTDLGTSTGTSTSTNTAGGDRGGSEAMFQGACWVLEGHTSLAKGAGNDDI